MKKITFFLMALLCLLGTLNSQDCTPDTAAYNTIYLQADSIIDRFDNIHFSAFDLMGWENKEVMLNDTVHLFIFSFYNHHWLRSEHNNSNIAELTLNYSTICGKFTSI